jgi:hypothetical protein
MYFHRLYPMLPTPQVTSGKWCGTCKNKTELMVLNYLKEMNIKVVTQYCGMKQMNTKLRQIRQAGLLSTRDAGSLTVLAQHGSCPL